MPSTNSIQLYVPTALFRFLQFALAAQGARWVRSKIEDGKSNGSTAASLRAQGLTKSTQNMGVASVAQLCEVAKLKLPGPRRLMDVTTA